MYQLDKTPFMGYDYEASTAATTAGTPASSGSQDLQITAARVEAKIRRGSNTSMSSLEDLVTCPIHLGIMEDPRLLTCGHAYCRSCIEQCLHSQSHTEAWSCPLCRQASYPSIPENVQNLPKAFTHNYIMQYIANRRLRHHDMTPMESKLLPTSRRIGRSRSGSLEDLGERSKSTRADAYVRAEILQQMIQDLTHRRGPLSDVVDAPKHIDTLKALLNTLSSHEIPEDEVTEEDYSNQITTLPSAPLDLDDGSHACEVTPFSSAYELLDMDTIRKNMKRHAEYRVLHRVSANVGPLKYNNTNIVCADAPFDADRQNGIIILLNCLDKESPTLLHRPISNHKLRIDKLRPNDSTQWRVNYFQYHQSLIYAIVMEDLPNTGGGGKVMKIVVLIENSGTVRVVRQSRPYNIAAHDNTTTTTTAPFSGDSSPPSNSATTWLHGFYIDDEREVMYVAMPWSHEIVMLNIHTLQETESPLLFHAHHPAFLVRHRSSQELWISCPQDGLLLILDERSSKIQKVGTENIYNAVPSHIILTSDERIVFLDSSQNRLFWIKRRHNYILVQRLDFRGALRDFQLTGLKSLKEDKIMIVAADGAILVRPLRSVSVAPNKRSAALCSIL